MSRNTVTRLRGALVAAMSVALVAGITSTAQAQTATITALTNWNVYSTHFGPNGEDAPLRHGRGDVAGSAGFGKLHIEDKHANQMSSWSNMKRDIDKTLDRGSCTTAGASGNRKTTCVLNSSTFYNTRARQMKVVFAHRVDSDSRDGRPVGIITAYYSICGC